MSLSETKVVGFQPNFRTTKLHKLIHSAICRYKAGCENMRWNWPLIWTCPVWVSASATLSRQFSVAWLVTAHDLPNPYVILDLSQHSARWCSAFLGWNSEDIRQASFASVLFQAFNQKWWSEIVNRAANYKGSQKQQASLAFHWKKSLEVCETINNLLGRWWHFSSPLIIAQLTSKKL